VGCFSLLAGEFKSNGHMQSNGTGSPRLVYCVLSENFARLGPGLIAWHSCALECFFLLQPPEDLSRGHDSDRACVAVFLSRVYAPCRPAVGGLFEWMYSA
jgi:hypothetical protein